MFKATLKSLLARKLRLVLSALAVLLGVAFVSGAFVLTDTLGKSFDKLFDNVNHNVAVDVRGTKTVGGGSDDRRDVPVSVVSTVRKVAGVAEVAPNVQGTAVLIDKNGKAQKSSGAPMLGLNWVDSDRLMPMQIKTGQPPRNADQIVLDAALAKDAHYKVGDTARVSTPKGTVAATVVGIGTYADGSQSLGGAQTVIFDTATAQKLLLTGGGYSDLRIAADKGMSQTELRDDIRKVLPGGVEAITGTKQADDQSKDIKTALGYFNTFLLVFAVVALFVGAFIIVNTFNILIAQRTRELALMRALGANRGQVNRSVLLEASIVGFIASVLGLAGGVGVAAGLRALVASGSDMPSAGLIIEARTVIVAFAVGIGVTIVAAMLPARRAGRVAPLAAMRDAATPDRSLNRQVIAGLVLLVAGGTGTGLGLAGTISLLLLGLSVMVGFIGITLLSPVFARPLVGALSAPFGKGPSAKLGRENSRRNPRRTAATAAALMVGIALVSAISVLGASLKTSTDKLVNQGVLANYVVLPDTGVDNAAADAARRTDGVSSVATMRTGQVRVGGKAVFATALSDGALGSALTLDRETGNVKKLGGDTILLSKSAAKARHASAGSTVGVTYPDGSKASLRVGGTFANGGIGGDYVLPSTALPHFKTQQWNGILIKADKGADGAALKKNLQTALKPYPTAEVKTRKELAGDAAKQIDQVLTIVNALLILSIIIAVLGVINTLALSVLERTRELGMLRAVGMSRRQVKRMVRVESIAISAFGGLLGVVVGTGLGVLLQRSLSDQGLSELSFPGRNLLIYFVASAIIGVVAAWIPARRATRLNVLRAIATD